MRDALSQRWVRTEETYARENPKRAYYVSMEFLLGRSLANNVTNLMLEVPVQRLAARDGLDLVALLEQEPDAGLGNGGLGASRLASSIRWRRSSCPRWATASATTTGCSGR